VIQYHKRLTGEKTESAINKQSDEALFKIFQDNYFKHALHDDHNLGYKWKKLIARGVVVYHDSNQFFICAR
jgi:hypothetical protein